jgi:purine-binding chemotaxis protein CheW
MSETRQYCTFHLADMVFGVEVLHVQEVLRYQVMTPVPLAPPTVRGLINLRGQIVTAIDLRTRLGMAPLPVDRNPMNVVIRTEEGAVSLLVDEIGDVVEVEEAAFERPPENLRGPARELTEGVYKLAGKLLLILNVEGTTSTPPGGERRDADVAHAITVAG